MAELNPAAAAPAIRTRDQLRAIAFVRLSLLRHSIRTTRGALEVFSRVWIGLWLAALGLGGAVGFAVLSWFLLTSHAQMLALPLWLLFAFWQIFPLAATAFTDTPDTSFLARFPLRYSAYFCLRLAFGAVDIPTMIGTLCLAGFAAGAVLAQPALLAWALAAALLFWVANVLIEQMIFAWLERWLARRRTREILALVFFLAIFSVNFIGPLFSRHPGFAGAWAAAWLPVLLPIARWLPPSLTAEAVTAPAPLALAALAALAAWAAAAGYLLHRRVLASYRGELLDDAAPSRRKPAARPAAAAGARERVSFSLPFGAAGAVAQKELRVLLRSPMMFFPLAMPVLLLLLFRMRAFGPNLNRGGQVHLAVAGYGFPIGVAYALLVLTNLIFNTLGTEGAGIQFYFASPASFRQVFLGKNLAYALVLAAEAAVLYIAVLLINGPPPALVVVLTVVGLAFAALCDFTCGNLLSLFLPKKFDLARLGRQNRGTTGIAALALQAVVGGMVALAVLTAVLLHRLWIAALLLLVLALAAAAIYRVVLQQLDRIALARREILIAELSKA